MNGEYRSKIEQVKIDGENFAKSAMKGVYAEQSAALDELHKIVGKVYIDHAKNGMLSLTAVEKSSIAEEATNHLKDMGFELSTSEVEKVGSILGNVFKDTYYKNIYTLESGMPINLKFNILKKEYVDAAVNAKYKGELFSERIWTNKADMIDSLKLSITNAMKGNTTIDDIGKQISERFNVTAYESQRLVMNEVARCQSQATDDMATATGVDQQMYSATLDGLTSSECANDDGKVWGIDDEDKVVPPENHVGCRCCLINVPYDGWSPTGRKDNETKEIIAYTNFEDWAADKGI